MCSIGQTLCSVGNQCVVSPDHLQLMPTLGKGFSQRCYDGYKNNTKFLPQIKNSVRGVGLSKWKQSVKTK